MTIEDLIAFEEIKQLKARYCYHLDLKEWDAYANLFTEDSIIISDRGVSTRGRDPDSMAPIKGRQEQHVFIERLLANADTVHQVHSPIIELTSATTAKAIWAMEDVVEMPGFYLQARGHYRETYRKEADGKWYIASLHLTRTRIDMLYGDRSGPDHIKS